MEVLAVTEGLTKAIILYIEAHANFTHQLLIYHFEKAFSMKPSLAISCKIIFLPHRLGSYQHF